MSKADLLLLNGLRALAAVPWMRGPASSVASLFLNAPRVQPSPSFPDLQLPKEPNDIVQELKATGVSTGLRLSAEAVQQVLAACHGATFTEDGTRQRFSYAQMLQHQTSKALRWLNPHQISPVVNQIATDERIVAVAREYLGMAPILHSSQIWLLQPPAPEHAAGHEYGWHYDIDDFRFLKLFIYLTDTQATGGEHMLVRGSHRDRRPHRARQRRIADQQIHSLYPAQDILRMEGGAGDGFFEDTWLYHRATPPAGNRLMMQIEFCSTGVMKRLEQRIYRPGAA